MKNTKLLVTALLCSVFAIPSANALDLNPEFYAGASAGVGIDQDACDQVKDGYNALDEFGIEPPSVSCDDSSAAFRILGGAQLHDNFAVEAGYTILGEHEYEAAGYTHPNPVIGAVPARTITADIRAFDLSLLGMYPVNEQISVRGRLGVAFWDAGIDNLPEESPIGDDSGTDLLIGLGGSFALNEQVSLTADWMRINADNGDYDTNFDVLLVGATYHF